MRFLTLLVYGLVAYLVLKLFKNTGSSGKSNIKVSGHQKETPLDLSNEDVEDVDYKDVK
jgi:hypothetical protein